jgi:hypothetical protein
VERDIVDEILAHRHKKQQPPLPYPATTDATASGNTRDIAPVRDQSAPLLLIGAYYIKMGLVLSASRYKK